MMSGRGQRQNFIVGGGDRIGNEMTEASENATARVASSHDSTIENFE